MASPVTPENRFLVEPADGTVVMEGPVGVIIKIPGTATNGVISIVEHPVAPRILRPPHVHQDNDEWSYILEGRIGFRIDDDEFIAETGSYILKPRRIPHTFWNPDDQPARILEIITPAGFERFFAELVDLGGVAQAGPEQLRELCQRFALEMDPDSVPDLIQRFGVRFPAEPLA